MVTHSTCSVVAIIQHPASSTKGLLRVVMHERLLMGETFKKDSLQLKRFKLLPQFTKNSFSSK